MFRIAALTLTAALAPIHAQIAEPHFEVASVKLNSAGGPRFGLIRRSPTTLTMRAISLWMAIRWAYDLESFQLTGPDWLQSGPLYDIDAKASQPTSQSQMRLMLRSLLAERFRTATHFEKRAVPVSGLIVAKGGAKLRASLGQYNPAAGAEVPLQFLGLDDSVHIQASVGPSGQRQETFTNAPMSVLASVLAMLSSRTPYDRVAVVDMTGLKGGFDFVLFHESEPGPRPEGTHATSEDVLAEYKPLLQKQLGLAIESRKSETSILVVDHAEKSPTSN